MVICLLIAILGFAIYAVSSIVTDRLLEQRIKRLEDFLKNADGSFDYEHATITQGDFAPQENAGSDMTNGLTYEQNKCSTCINDKGCINCENGNQYETSSEVKEMYIKKEVIDWWNAHYSSTFERYTGHYLINSTLFKIAKHFYELGLKANKE